MAELTLTFTPPPGAELIATHFAHPRLKASLEARLGAYDRSFRWTAGVQALAALFLRTAAWGRNGRDLHPEPPCLEGRRPSMAASLNDVMTGRPRWVEDVFGVANGEPVLLSLLDRWNPDYNCSPKAPVRVWVECATLPPDRIRVLVDGREVTAPQSLARLAEDVARQWSSRRATAPEPLESDDARGASDESPAGVRLTVRQSTVRIEIELDRDFDGFDAEQEEKLLEAIRLLLSTGRDIPVVDRRRGSVILTLELTPDEAERLAEIIRAGRLAEFGAVATRVVSTVVRENGPESLPPTPASGTETTAGSVQPLAGDLHPSADPWPTVGAQFAGVDLISELHRDASGGSFLANIPDVNRFCTLHLSRRQGGLQTGLGRLAYPGLIDCFWVRQVGGWAVTCTSFYGVTTLADLVSAAFPERGAPPPATAGIILRVAEADTRKVPTWLAPLVRQEEPYLIGVTVVAARVADVVAYLHRNGVSHGDLKPSNVVIGSGGIPHLVDLNLSSGEGATDAVLGTPAYMAPEAIDAALAGTPVTASQAVRADLFSFGVVVYELLTGRLPFAQDGEGGLAALAAAARAGRPEMPAGLPAAAAAVLTACLSADPARRPADAGAVAAALDRVVLAHRGRGRRRRRWAVGAACVALLGLGGTAAVVALGRNEAGVASTAEDYFTRGLASLEAGDLRSARADFEAAGARARDPKYPAYLAYTFALLDENVKSAEAAEKAIDGGGRTAEVLNNYGYALWWLDRQPDKAKAKARIAEALVLNPKLPAAKYNRAMNTMSAQFQTGRPGIDPLAVADMKDVLAAGLRSPDLHHHAAQVFAAGRDDDPKLEDAALAQVEAAIRAGKSRDLVANDPILTTKLGRLSGFGKATAVPQGTPPPNPPKYRLVEPHF